MPVFNVFVMLFVAIGRLCEKCDGKCVICDSYVRPCTLVRICDECNYGSYQGRCVICGGPGVSDAYYCKECTIQEKDVSTFIHSLDTRNHYNHFPSLGLALIIFLRIIFNIVPSAGLGVLLRGFDYSLSLDQVGWKLHTFQGLFTSFILQISS